MPTPLPLAHAEHTPHESQLSSVERQRKGVEVRFKKQKGRKTWDLGETRVDGGEKRPRVKRESGLVNPKVK